jgi:hypothetical protein
METGVGCVMSFKADLAGEDADFRGDFGGVGMTAAVAGDGRAKDRAGFGE